MFLSKKTAQGVKPTAILNAISSAVLAVNQEYEISYANQSAEHLFGSSAEFLHRLSLHDLIPLDSPIFSLIHQAFETTNRVAEYDLTLESPRVGKHLVNVTVSPVAEQPGCVVIAFEQRSMAHKINTQLSSRNAARSVTAMARMLAHEVKNPLSGIRGAAQLLEHNASDEDTSLTNLICDETDRICKLLERMEAFSDAPLERGPVNIHAVLEHARRVAENGFGRHVTFEEYYDPSLPLVSGHRDQLIQIFLNLIKNACEAVDSKSGNVILKTHYQHGIRLAVPGHGSQMHLPLVISVTDNGPGIAEDIARHLFDPFVTNKPNGSGLGLSLVAKLVNDHAGVIEFDSVPNKGSVFRTLLPMHVRRRC